MQQTQNYRVLSVRGVLGYEQGEEFERAFTVDEERDYLDRGQLEIVPREYRVVGPNEVNGVKAPDTFTAAMRIENERQLLDGGQIERVDGAAPDDLTKLTRAELNERATALGIEDPAALKDKQAVIDAIEAADTTSEEE